MKTLVIQTETKPNLSSKCFIQQQTLLHIYMIFNFNVLWMKI